MSSTEDEKIFESVQKHGWFAINVHDRLPPFLYTIGLMHTLSHPDFIAFGLEGDDAYALMSDLIRNIRAGQLGVTTGSANCNRTSRFH